MLRIRFSLTIGTFGWLAFAGCNGSVVSVEHETVGGNAATGGATGMAQGGGGQPNTNPVDSTGGTANPTTGTTCTGSLETVRALWERCPDSYCKAIAWVSDCSSFGVEPFSRMVGLCGLLQTEVMIGWGTHSMTCYYAAPAGNGRDTPLAGAEDTDDVPTFCNQTSRRIEAGTTSCEEPALENDFGSCTHGTGGTSGTGGATGIGIGGC